MYFPWAKVLSTCPEGIRGRFWQHVLPSFSVVLAVLRLEVLGPFNQVLPKDISCLLMMLIFPQTDAERWWQRIYANEKLNRNLRYLDQGKSLAEVNKPKLCQKCTEQGLMTKQLQDKEEGFAGVFATVCIWANCEWSNDGQIDGTKAIISALFAAGSCSSLSRERESHTKIDFRLKVANCPKIFFREDLTDLIEKITKFPSISNDLKCNK